MNTFSRPSLYPALSHCGGKEELATHPRKGRGCAVPTQTEDGTRALSEARAALSDDDQKLDEPNQKKRGALSMIRWNKYNIATADRAHRCYQAAVCLTLTRARRELVHRLEDWLRLLCGRASRAGRAA